MEELVLVEELVISGRVDTGRKASNDGGAGNWWRSCLGPDICVLGHEVRMGSGSGSNL